MSCTQVEQALEEHGLEGITRELKGHVKDCPHCGNLVRALDRLDESLRALPVSSAPPSWAPNDSRQLPSIEVLAERRAEAAWSLPSSASRSGPSAPRFGVPVPETNRLPRWALAAAVIAAVLGVAAAALFTGSPDASSAHWEVQTADDGRSKTVDALQR
ncbi:MAG: hypothetical protein AAFY60_13590 [Myxococcota bacterium]